MGVPLSSIVKNCKYPFSAFQNVVILGDSIDAGKASYSNLFCMLFGATVVKDAGVGGNTLAEMLARFQTDVAPYSPDFVTIKGGTNDVGRVGYSESASLASLTEIINNVRYISAVALVVLPPPRNTYTTEIISLRKKIALLCRSMGVHCYDPFQVYINTANGQWASGASLDGVHPIQSVAKGAGEAMLALVIKHFQANTLPYPTENITGCGTFSNPLFLTDTNADGIADGLYGGFTGTPSLITDAFFIGKAQKATFTSRTGSANNTFNIGNIDSAKQYLVVAKLKLSEFSDPICLLNCFAYTANSNTKTYMIQQAACSDAEYLLSCIVKDTPLADTQLRLTFSIDNTGTWSGEIMLGQVQAYAL